MKMKTKRTIEELLQTPYWIIDILPKQVPADSPEQCFAIEKYYLDKDRLAVIKEKHINVILKSKEDEDARFYWIDILVNILGLDKVRQMWTRMS